MPNQSARAFTLVEMLVVIGIIAVLAALLLPALSSGQMRAKRIVCENHLRQIGLAFHGFAHDHAGKFSMAVPVSDGGSREFAENGLLVNGNFYFGYRHFQTLGNNLGSPKLLICPSDTRLAATNFASIQNANLSYFVGTSAEFAQPMSILAGDGNLASPATVLRGTKGGRMMWTSTQHRFKGNVLFADGHVEEWGNSSSGKSIASTENFVLPTMNPPGNPAASNPNQNDTAHPISNTPTNPTPSPTARTNGNPLPPQSSPTPKSTSQPETAPNSHKSSPTASDSGAAAPPTQVKFVAPIVDPSKLPMTLTPPPTKSPASNPLNSPEMTNQPKLQKNLQTNLQSTGVEVTTTNISQLPDAVQTSSKLLQNTDGWSWPMWLLLLLLIVALLLWLSLRKVNDGRNGR